MKTFEEINHYLINQLPADQINAVMSQRECDIDNEFLGFVDTYYHLSNLIPKHFTVLDFGCAYNAQSFFFTNHLRYIAVDISECVKFKAGNCEIFNTTIRYFINKELPKLNLDLDECFAICNNVPDWDDKNSQLVRFAFGNLYSFYTSNKKMQHELYNILSIKRTNNHK